MAIPIQYNLADISDKLIQEFWNRGYIILEGYFEEKLMDELSAERRSFGVKTGGTPFGELPAGRSDLRCALRGARE